MPITTHQPSQINIGWGAKKIQCIEGITCWQFLAHPTLVEKYAIRQVGSSPQGLWVTTSLSRTHKRLCLVSRIKVIEGYKFR